jgi:hypothetical protein
MSEMDNDPFFRQLEIIAGAKWPVSWDTRDFLLRSSINGNTDLISVRMANERARALPYLRSLLELADDASESDVLSALTKARAQKVGLSQSADFCAVVACECIENIPALTMWDLRRERDERNGTYRPLVNDGQW